MAEREVSVTAGPEGLGHLLMHLPGPPCSGRGVHAPASPSAGLGEPSGKGCWPGTASMF